MITIPVKITLGILGASTVAVGGWQIYEKIIKEESTSLESNTGSQITKPAGTTGTKSNE